MQNLKKEAKSILTISKSDPKLNFKPSLNAVYDKIITHDLTVLSLSELQELCDTPSPLNQFFVNQHLAIIKKVQAEKLQDESFSPKCRP